MRRLKKRDRLDPMDAELIRETILTPGWQLVREGIEKMLFRKTRDLVRPQKEVETAALRGAIDALETVLKVPEILIQEGKNTNGRESN